MSGAPHSAISSESTLPPPFHRGDSPPDLVPRLGWGRSQTDSMEKLRGAIVGFGFIMEKGHAAGYRQRTQAGAPGDLDLEIVAIADLSPARRALAQQHFPGARI